MDNSGGRNRSGDEGVNLNVSLVAASRTSPLLNSPPVFNAVLLDFHDKFQCVKTRMMCIEAGRLVQPFCCS